MLIDTDIECPVCGAVTSASVSVPAPGTRADKQAAASRCTVCTAMLLLTTGPDGTVVVSGLEPASAGTGASPSTVVRPFALDDVVDVPTGIARPRGIAIDGFTLRADWADAVRHELEAAQQRPRPLSTPRRIFISYRWGTPDDDEWVVRLHDELVQRGNDVVFDRAAQRAAKPPSVPALVAEIASCHMFLAVFDPGYLERVTGTGGEAQVDGWVTDEFHTAVRFAASELVLLVGLLRAGDALPDPFVPFTFDTPGNTFDVRTSASLGPALDQFFQQVAAPPPAALAHDAALALMESTHAIDSGDVDAAADAADRACQLIPELPDGFAQRARVARRKGTPEPALRDATRALEIDPTLADVRLNAAEAAAACGQWATAAEHARRLVERDRSDGAAHVVLGRALDALDCVGPAMAHLEHARRAGCTSHDMYLAGGITALRGADPHAALAWLRAGIAEHPASRALHLNATLAAMQGGSPTAAYDQLQLLVEQCPDEAQIPDVTQLLVDWCQSDGPPPQFLEPVPVEPHNARFECEGCGARVSLPTLDSLLCAGCGAVCASAVGPCARCGADGRTGHRIGGVCPICHGREACYIAVEAVVAP